MTENKCKNSKANVFHKNIARWVFLRITSLDTSFYRIMACLLLTIELKHLHIEIVLCLNFWNIAFIWQKTVRNSNNNKNNDNSNNIYVKMNKKTLAWLFYFATEIKVDLQRNSRYPFHFNSLSRSSNLLGFHSNLKTNMSELLTAHVLGI